MYTYIYIYIYIYIHIITLYDTVAAPGCWAMLFTPVPASQQVPSDTILYPRVQQVSCTNRLGHGHGHGHGYVGISQRICKHDNKQA